MANSKIIGGIGVLALAFTSPSFAKGDGEHPQQSMQNGAERQKDAASEQQPRSGWARLGPNQVEQVQQELKARGYYDGDVDGIAGPNTRAALQSYQKNEGINGPGPNRETLTALGVGSERQPVSGMDKPEQQTAVGRDQNGAAKPMPGAGQSEPQHALSALSEEQVREVQVRLQERGYYQGEIDGVIGPQTRAALSRFFARQAQLVQQGQLTESALSAFGLESSEIQPVGGTDSQPSTSQRGPGTVH
jgi:peptidoglycan hydrolase-like protein with peptidoglycan-binding domain